MRRALLRFPHLSFIPPVIYPPLRGTFPLRERLCIGYSDSLANGALETISHSLSYRHCPIQLTSLATFPSRGRLYVGDSDAFVYDALETIFSLSFMPPVPYPPLRCTFPMRGRLCSSALFFPRILYSFWLYRLKACRASILRKQKPLCEDGLCRAVSGSIIPQSRILRDFLAYPHHFLS